MTRLTEMTVGVTLARVLDDLDEGRWLAGDTVGYARTDSGNEVDFCPVDAATPAGSERTVPIESKWVDTGWRGEGRVVAGKYNAGVLPTVSLERYGVKRNVLCILGVGEQYGNPWTRTATTWRGMVPSAVERAVHRDQLWWALVHRSGFGAVLLLSAASG